MDHSIFCCPICQGDLDGQFRCLNCEIRFPVVKNIPILINEQNSVFCLNDYSEEKAYSFFGEAKRWKGINQFIPRTGLNYAAKDNYRLFSTLLSDKGYQPLVLIIGGGITGAGMKDLFQQGDVEFVHTDVSLTNQTQLICDGHDLPFKNESFDGVIIQAVLEHVVDPFRCVAEIHRVLKEDGIVYAETPFMQPVHGGAYDFMRFTSLGHRRLFRVFEEINSGTCCGPGMALSDAWYYFLRSFTQNKISLAFIRAFASYTSFFLKYFDYYLRKKPNSLDISSGNYFLGRKKSGYLLGDRELIQMYKIKVKSKK